MRSLIRDLMLAIIIVGVLVVVGYVAASYRIYDNATRVEANCQSPQAVSNADFTPDNFTAAPDRPTLDVSRYAMPNWEEVEFSSRSEDIVVRAYFVPAPDVPEREARTVIVTHGLNECKNVNSVLIAAGMLHANGFNVLILDLRNHGTSQVTDGRASLGRGDHNDILGAWDYLVSVRTIAPSQIGVYGQGLGASLSLIATGQEPSLSAVWADAPYTNLELVVEVNIQERGLASLLETGVLSIGGGLSPVELGGITPLDLIGQLTGSSVYIVYGNADNPQIADNRQQLVTALQEQNVDVTVWEADGDTDNETEENAEEVTAPVSIASEDVIFDFMMEYEARLVAFFEDNLAVP